MNLKIDSSTVVFFCESCEIFNNIYLSYNGDECEWLEMTKVMGLANFEGQ